jgi:hypothetical protein
MALLTQTHTSGINARRLLQQMADMYSHSIEETVLIEAIANALDAGASNIRLGRDLKAGSLIITDDGHGMSENDFRDYHDLAESDKARGGGIGFAGLGAKLAHQVGRTVRTDTRAVTGYSAGSNWSWRANSLVWRQRKSNLKSVGTQVEVQLNDPQSPLLDSGWLEQQVRTHYGPLLEPILKQHYLIGGIYPGGVDFHIDSSRLEPRTMLDESAIASSAYRDIHVPRGRRVIGRAFFALAKRQLPEGMRGVAIATMGKVIRHDTLGVNPRSGDRITGWVEVPELVQYLTTNKQAFIDNGAQGVRYRRLRAQVQEQYTEWLAELGENIDAGEATRAPRMLERELADITKALPELNYLFGRRERAQVPVASPTGPESSRESEGALMTGGIPGGAVENPNGGTPTAEGSDEGFHLEFVDAGAVPARRRPRVTRRGPRVRLVDDPQRDEMSWLDADSVCINTAHPAYRRAYREGNTKYHQRVAALIAVCRGASGDEPLELLDKAMRAWGRRLRHDT